jgi:hypothetical protein
VLEKLARINYWTVGEIKAVLAAVLADEFWCKQIKSLRGIRNKSSNGNLKIENARAAVEILPPEATYEDLQQMKADGKIDSIPGPYRKEGDKWIL